MKYLTLSLMIVILSGCSLFCPKPEIIVKEKTTYITVPASMLLKCKTTKPPELISYLEFSEQDKENTLTDYSISLIKDINKCNIQLEEIKAFQKSAMSAIKTNEK
jgi:hypothetical protein